MKQPNLRQHYPGQTEQRNTQCSTDQQRSQHSQTLLLSTSYFWLDDHLEVGQSSCLSLANRVKGLHGWDTPTEIHTNSSESYHYCFFRRRSEVGFGGDTVPAAGRWLLLTGPDVGGKSGGAFGFGITPNRPRYKLYIKKKHFPASRLIYSGLQTSSSSVARGTRQYFKEKKRRRKKKIFPLCLFFTWAAVVVVIVVSELYYIEMLW